MVKCLGATLRSFLEGLSAVLHAEGWTMSWRNDHGHRHSVTAKYCEHFTPETYRAERAPGLARKLRYDEPLVADMRWMSVA